MELIYFTQYYRLDMEEARFYSVSDDTFFFFRLIKRRVSIAVPEWPRIEYGYLDVSEEDDSTEGFVEECVPEVECIHCGRSATSTSRTTAWIPDHQYKELVRWDPGKDRQWRGDSLLAQWQELLIAALCMPSGWAVLWEFAAL